MEGLLAATFHNISVAVAIVVFLNSLLTLRHGRFYARGNVRGLQELELQHQGRRQFRACLHGGGEPQVGEVTRLGGVTRLSI